MGILMAKKLWKYVVKAGSTADDEYDQQAKGFIWINIEHQQRSHVPAGATAHQTWEALCKKHEQVGPQVISNCIFGIIAIRYVDGTKMEDHLARLKEYFTRLDAVDCKLPETVKAVFVLASLPQSWTVFKQTQTAAASTSNPLTVSTVCLAILQERDRRLNEDRATQSLIDSASALAASQGPPPRRGRSNRSPDSRDNLLCQWCGRTRHEEKECYAKRDGKPRTYFGARDNAHVASAAPTSNHFVFTASEHFVLTAAATPPEAGTWYVDSGASNHYCREAHLVKGATPCIGPDIVSANGGRVPIVSSGAVDIMAAPFKQRGADLRITLTGVSVAPGLAANLVSVRRLCQAGLDVRFFGTQCLIKQGKRLLAVADLTDNNLFRLRTSPHSESTSIRDVEAPKSQHGGDVPYCLSTGKELDLPLPELWHRRLGHIHHMAVANLLGNHMTADVHHTISGDAVHCEPCVLGKHHRAATSKFKAGRADRPLFRLHLDLCGPFPPAHDGSIYLLQIVDDYSRYVWARTMPNKETTTVLRHLQQVVAEGEAMHAGNRVSVLRSDNGSEFTSKAVTAWRESRGIRHERTATYTPHQNGVVERMNRAVVELARTTMLAAKLPQTFWALAVDVAAYCRNRSPTTSLDNRTPYEAWHDKRPAVSHMRIFGCLAFAHIRKELRSKLDAKADAYIFVGYSPDSITYRLWDPRAKAIVESRDVHFVENQLGIAAGGAAYDKAAASTSLLPRIDIPDSTTAPSSLPPRIDFPDGDDLPSLIPPPNDARVPAAPPLSPQQVHSQTQPVESAAAELPSQPAAQPAANQPRALSREMRRLQDALHSGPKYHAPSTVANFALIAHSKASHSTNGSVESDPTTYKAAVNSSQVQLWRAAMDSEMASLDKAGTFTLVPLPAHRSAIGCKWVFKTKRGADGAVTKHKARLVAKGFLQRYGVDYDETYAPVARFPSIRVILALTAHHDWELHQMDVKSAYLNGDLEEDIYMAQPEGYAAPGQEHLVCKLNKSLYGLKQAGRTWHTKIDVALKREQFVALDADQCVYMRRQDARITIIALYVDDLLIACSDVNSLAELKKRLTAQFDMEDLGEASFILGVDICRDRSRRTISIGQSAYVTSLLDRHGMSECKPISTPMEHGFKTAAIQTSADYKATESEIREYQGIIGGLMFAMVCTRPDIAYAVTTLAQFASNPAPVHAQALKRVLRYLRGTIERRITYAGNGDIDSQPRLLGYCDADWGGGHRCRSVTGYVFMLAGGAISWQSKKQKTVALSTVEAEYMATTQATKEAIWWRSFLRGVGHDMSATTVIHSDSQGSIALAHNPEHHARTKHIDIQYHFIRQHIADKTITLLFVGTEHMLADIFTKALDRTAYEQGAQRLGLSESSSRGGVDNVRAETAQ